MTNSDKVYKWFEDNGLWMEIDPFDERTIEKYQELLYGKMRELYQFLVTEEIIPEFTFDKFQKLIRYKLHEARHLAILESV